MKPFTVILMLPDYWRSQQTCAADEVQRHWVTAPGPDEAIDAALDAATAEKEAPREDFAAIAVFAGHQFDLFQP